MSKTSKIKFLILAVTCMVLCLFTGITMMSVSADATVDAKINCVDASLRVGTGEDETKDYNGIRYAVAIAKDDYASYEDKSIGILVLPTDLIPEGEELTLSTAKAQSKLLDADSWRLNEEGTVYENFAYLFNLPTNMYARSITFRAYIGEGATATYSAATSICMADVGLLAKADYTADTSLTEEVKQEEINKIKKYFTYTISYDLGVREASTSTETTPTETSAPPAWKVETKEIEYDKANAITAEKLIEMAPTAPTREGLFFLEWKHTAGDLAVIGEIKVESMWLLVGDINITSAEQLWNYVEVGNYSWKAGMNEGKLTFWQVWDSGSKSIFVWKNIFTAGGDFSIEMKGRIIDCVQVSDGVGKYMNMGCINSTTNADLWFTGGTHVVGQPPKEFDSKAKNITIDKSGVTQVELSSGSYYEMPKFTIYPSGSANIKIGGRIEMDTFKIGLPIAA